MFLLFLFNCSWEFYSYKTFLNSSSFLKGRVVQAYEKTSKHGKRYQVLKIKSEGKSIYTTRWKKPFRIKQNDGIIFKLNKKSISFLDFLSRSFYASSYAVKTYKAKPFKLKLLHLITSQHKNAQMSSLYGALFLASPLSKDLRKKIQNFGINHLVAISGFHLGLIWGVLFFVLRAFYGFFHDRYFPYRNLNLDLGIATFAILAFYAYLIDFSPSFLRAYMMSLLAFIFYLRYFEVFSFTTLALSVAFLLAFFPHFLFSIGFWFSVLGVFYIFLYLHHFSFSWWDALFINAWVFVAMLIPVHFVFEYFSLQQFFSIPLSLVFVLFYPLAFLLHLLGFGYAFDGILMQGLELSWAGFSIKTPLWLLCVYILLSLLSIKSKVLAIFTLSLGLVFVTLSSIFA